ncbi:MAG: alpha/beta fold hydrolase [Myxococcota bacterium]
MPHVTVDGLPVRYREEPGPAGAPTLVLLHMAGGGSSVWGPVASRLGRRFHVVAPDFPAHGQSAPNPHLDQQPGAITGVHPRITALARWTLQLMDALKVERAILAGHSLGGMVALSVALLAPARVAGLGLVCTSGRLRLAPGLLEAIEADFEGFARTFTAAAVPANLPTTDRTRVQPIFPQASKAEVLADFRAVDGLDLLPQLGGVGVPCVVVAGVQDVLTPLAHADDLCRTLKSARLVPMEGCGHLAPREAPARVAEALLALADR